MKIGCFPLGSASRTYTLPSDVLTKEVSKLITSPSDIRDFFQENVYVAPEGTLHQVSDLVRALPVCVEADRIASVIRREKRQASIEESEIIARADALRDALVQVDSFEFLTEEEGRPGYIRPALQGTNERMAQFARKSFNQDLAA
jgi:hypothetical protein